MKNKEKLRCIFEKLYGRVQESREIKGKKKKKIEMAPKSNRSFVFYMSYFYMEETSR